MEPGTAVRAARVSLFRLVLLFLSGPAVWSIYQLSAFAMVGPACATGSGAMLLALGAAALLATATAAWLSRSGMRRLSAPGEGSDARRFLATSSYWLNLVFALLIATAVAAVFVLSPCE